MNEREIRALIASIIIIGMFSIYFFIFHNLLTVGSYIFMSLMGYKLILEDPRRTIIWAVAIAFAAVAMKLVIDTIPYFKKGDWGSWIVIIFFIMVAGWFYYHSRKLKKM